MSVLSSGFQGLQRLLQQSVSARVSGVSFPQHARTGDFRCDPALTASGRFPLRMQHGRANGFTFGIRVTNIIALFLGLLSEQTMLV